MSNPAPWGQNIPGDQQGGGQITFFDPTKFQKGPQDFPNIPDSHQKNQQDQPNSHTGHEANQVSGNNAWAAWSWADASNPYVKQESIEQNVADYGYQNQWNGQQFSQGQQVQPQQPHQNGPNQMTQEHQQHQNGPNQMIQEHQQQHQNDQFYWDPNTQQWQPNYTGHSQVAQQQVDQNQHVYNQYWNGGVSQNSAVAGNSQWTNTVADTNCSQQNSALGSVQNSGIAQQVSIRDTDLSSSHDKNQPNSYLNHFNNTPQQNEYLNQSISSYDQNQQDNLTTSVPTNEGGESVDQSEGSVGRFFMNDYEGEVENVTGQANIPSVSGSEEQIHNREVLNIEQTNISAESNSSDNIQSHMLGNEPESVPNQVNLAAQSIESVAINNDPLSQDYNHESVKQSDQAYPYYAVDASQAQPVNIAKESEKEDEGSHHTKSETHSEDDWELVQPHGLVPNSHSRTQSMDNNVQFFISSGNSSLRVSPSGSSKSKDDLDGIPGHHASQTEALIGDNNKIDGEPHVHVTDNKTEVNSFVPPPVTVTGLSAPPPTLTLGPPPMGMGSGSNPFRKSPSQTDSSMLKADNPSPVTQESLLSSTRLDSTKTNFENSPVVLNQSISPIPPGLDLHRDTANNASPDIHNIGKPNQNPDTPVSSVNQRKPVVPQSPIMPRKESPFQPPGQMIRNSTDSRSKPVKASHTIPGVSANEQQNLSAYNKAGRKTPDVDGERGGRKTPDWDRNNERSVGDNKSGRKTPDWDIDRRGYERRTGRRTPDWDRDRTTDRNRGRRTPDWDSRQNSDRYGRRTPEWDRERNNDRSLGRRTPDWDSKQSSSRYGRKTPDWDQSTDTENKKFYDGDRLASKPPAGTLGTSNKAPSQRAPGRQSAFRDMVKNRSKNNVSPATSLLDFEPPVVSNILLVPAALDTKSTNIDKSKKVSDDLSELKPVASLINSLSEQINTDDNVSKLKAQPKIRNDESSEKFKSDTRETINRTAYDRNRDRDPRDTLRHNRSYEKGLNDARNASRDKLRSYGSRDSLENELQDDSSKERHQRGSSRDRDRLDPYDRYYRDRDRERPPSRNTEDYKRNVYRDREYGRPNDRYERPRSRNEENRPPSRQGDLDRSRSRADYDRDSYYRDRKKGYDYDDYYRRTGQYYERSYYDYYNYYNQGYYDEMGYYHDPNSSRYAYDQYQRRTRAGTPGSLSDAGDESKSGDKGKLADSETKNTRFEYPPDLHQYSGYYDDQYGYYSDYNGHRWDPHIQQWVQQTAVEQEPRRATPEKFTIPHMRASFGPNGQIVKILPNRPTDGQPATIEIHEVEAMLAENTESLELREFPGPLIRGDTHKNDVLLFCQRKAKDCPDNMELDDRESVELIWRFLELLIKQNGTVVGTDIADLLLEGHEPTTMDYRRTGMKIAQSLDTLDGDEDGEVEQSVVSSERSVINRTKTVEEVTDRFRHLLLYGRKKDALDWAMKNNLWGHALFLASKMDSRAHANVMTRFANVAMRMNDPLQTLYQLMSARQPAAVTCVAEERWGDWRPHLAMILSNHTSRPDLDRKSITQLGDTLAAKGYLHASHFCYLMSQTSFGSYNKKTSKIVLIGSSHSNLPLELFGNNEAIQCTEIYEYALALGNAAVCLYNFQSFKYLYATRLSDWGYPQEALQYLEVIAKNINMNPALYQHILVKLVYDLASQLKYSDPQKLEETDDSLDSDWLRGLHTTLVQFEEGAIQTMSGAATPMFFSGTRASSESGEVGMYMQGGDFGSQGSFAQDNGYGNQLGQMQGIQEQTAYPGYGLGDFQGHLTQGQGQYQQEAVADQSQYQNQYQAVTDEGQGQQADGNQWQQYGAGENQGGSEIQNNWQQGYLNYDQQQWSQHQQTTTTDPARQALDQTDSANQAQHQFHQSTDPLTTSWSTSHNKTSGIPPNTNLANSMGSTDSAKRGSVASTSSFSRGTSLEPEDDDNGEDLDSMGSGPQPGIFDLQPTGPQKIIAPRLRKRTISESSVGSSGAPAGSHKQAEQKKVENRQGLDKNKANGKGGEGIWGKIGGLFSRKGKNEMILPDDKEPSIVWDEDKKQWVNKDGTEDTSSIAAPPPKDFELSGGGGLKPPGSLTEKRNSMPVAPLGPGTDSAGNVFQRRKGPLGARGQYVDVLNPKPASSTNQVPSGLFNTLPHTQSAPAIFVPGGAADDSSKKSSPAPEPIQEEKTSPPPVPTQHSNTLSVKQEDSLSRSSSMSSVSQEVQQILLQKETPPPSVPSAAPVLFNPAQFQGNQSQKQSQGGAGHRLSSRRVYPK